MSRIKVCSSHKEKIQLVNIEFSMVIALNVLYWKQIVGIIWNCSSGERCGWPLASCSVEWLIINFFCSLHAHSSGVIPSITVMDRQITNVFPTTGSLRGGTKLTISGQGFSKLTSANKVKVGDHDCVVESSSLSGSSLTCQIADTGRTHLVTNDGVHPSKTYL